MARKGRKKGSPSRSGGSPWLFLVVAYGFGLLCVASGILVLVFGSGHARGGGEATASDVLVWGIMMIVIGVAALAVTVLIQWTKR